MDDYEYKGLMAQAWDVLRGDTSNWSDRFFFLEVIRRFGQPVLDVGCGTGRLLLDHQAQGVDVDGVEKTAQMLQLCQQKAQALGITPRVTLQTMETLALPRTYRTILVPSSSFQLVIAPQDVTRAMQRLCQHLQPGGVLAMPFMTLWKAGEPLNSTWEKSAQRASDGVTIRRVAYSRFNPETECEDTRDVYQVLREGQVLAEEVHQRAPATRSYTQSQARELFRAARIDRHSVFS